MSGRPDGLVAEAEHKAKGKANGYTATGKCGCTVRVSWFSEDSYSIRFGYCPEHPAEKGTP